MSTHALHTSGSAWLVLRTLLHPFVRVSHHGADQTTQGVGRGSGDQLAERVLLISVDVKAVGRLAFVQISTDQTAHGKPCRPWFIWLTCIL